MCSRVRGPAIAPSLVTWPTSTMGTPVSLATVSRRATASRTWLGLPGVPAASGALTVWMESTTASGGRSLLIAAASASRSVSASTATDGTRQPSRSARIATCSADSSPAQYSTG